MGFRSYRGYTKSENGWPIVDRDEIVVTTLPGMKNVKFETRKGDVTTVLVAWGIWYHRNVEPLDEYQPRDEWGFSWDNDVPNSNHLSGTAQDFNATKYPWMRYVMKQTIVDRINEGLRLFEGNIFHGRNWSRVDEMHYQIGKYDPEKLAAFAKKLRDGYLGIYAPADPNTFPLPAGYYFGPLEGPKESISMRFGGEQPAWGIALKRWQKAAGIPETGIYDAATIAVCKEIQKAKGWPQHGRLDTGEWDYIIKDQQAVQLPVPEFPTPPAEEEQAGVYWADVSEYQVHVDDTYPHRIFCLRSNNGSVEDKKFRENYKRARAMVEAGRLDAIIVYYFFRPGRANCDMWLRLVQVDGKIPPYVVCMIDVEGAHGSAQGPVTGNVSAEVNDEANRVAGWLEDRRRVIGYYNRNADPTLWPTRPDWMKFVVPWYNNDVSRSPQFPNLIAHQYTDRGACKPFGNCDMNFANLRLSQLLSELGMKVEVTQPGGAPSWSPWVAVAGELGVPS